MALIVTTTLLFIGCSARTVVLVGRPSFSIYSSSGTEILETGPPDLDDPVEICPVDRPNFQIEGPPTTPQAVGPTSEARGQMRQFLEPTGHQVEALVSPLQKTAPRGRLRYPGGGLSSTRGRPTVARPNT